MTILPAFVAAVVEFKYFSLILLVPIPIALMIVAAIAYTEWRWELINIAADIKKTTAEKSSLPENCHYESKFRESQMRKAALTTIPDMTSSRPITVNQCL